MREEEVVIEMPMNARRLVVIKMKGMGETPDWGVNVRGPGKVCGVWFDVEESKTRGPDGKPLTARLVPLVAFDCDPRLELRHHEYCWCTSGMEINSPFRLVHVGTYPTPSGLISLYEKMIPPEMQIPTEEGSNDLAPVAGLIDGR